MSASLSIQCFVEVIALVATIVAVAYFKRKSGSSLPVSSIAWAAPPILLLLFLGIWGQMGLLDGDAESFATQLSLVAIGACSVVSLLRTRIWDMYDKCAKPVRIALGVALVVVILVLPLFVIEGPYNSHMAETMALPTFAWVEILICGLLLVALYFLAQRHAVLSAVAMAAFCFIGVAQYFIKSFKNAAILPADLFALGTAAAVSNEYVFLLNGEALHGIAYVALAICALSLLRPPSPVSDQAGVRKRNVAINMGAFVAAIGAFALLVLSPNNMSAIGVKLEYWYTMDYYMEQGFIPSFMAVLQDMPIRRPDGYSDQEAQQITESHAEHYRTVTASNEEHAKTAAQFEQQKPTVIAVMNESFCDLSLFDELHAGYTGPEYFNNGINDALAHGRLYVCAYGGGTCNSEFEFLTGNAMGFVGYGKYPYSIYNFKNVSALAADFKNMGYSTTAIHPNYATNWNRDEIYEQMGFDTFLSIDDFGGIPDCEVDKVTPNEPHSEVFHSGVSDKATYDRVLELLKSNDSPQFIFDVTMANHGSYDQENLPAQYKLDYRPTNYDGEIQPEELNEYLGCIKRSDEDLKEFIQELREIDRPVVLVFFGDHQPGITYSYNDLWYANEPDDVHARRIYSTNYVIWANYDVAGQEQTSRDEQISVDMLGARTLELIGAPTNDYQAAKLDIRASIPALAQANYLGANGTWYTPDTESAYTQAYNDLANMEYLNFASKV